MQSKPIPETEDTVSIMVLAKSTLRPVGIINAQEGEFLGGLWVGSILNTVTFG